ncbi:MAG: NAD-dependent protein deacetylase [Nannocystales bacterium]
MPEHDVQLAQLVALLRGRRFATLTGAGISTDSGIPDYRGPKTRNQPRNPIQHREFAQSPATRRRYWARATRGWPRFAAAVPNAGHRALRQLQDLGVVTGLITQNVDGLHHAAGSTALELHGSLHEVSCLACGAEEARASVHARMVERNPSFEAHVLGVAPDGDVDLGAEAVQGFDVAPCLRCGGPLKPSVVFFGGAVPRVTVGAAYAIVDAADALLVVGSSLTVFSGYRFVRRAEARGIPVAIVNLGVTRGDPHADLRIDASAGAVLAGLVAGLEAG